MWTSTLVRRLASASLVGMLAFGVSGAGSALAASRDDHHASVKVAVTPPGSGAMAGASFADTIVVSNQGQASSRDVTLTVQYDPAIVQLQGVQFDRAGAWVSSTMPNGFAANIGGLGSDGDAVTITANFMATAAYSPDKPLEAQLSTNWRDESGSHSGTINAALAEAAGQLMTAPMIANQGMVSVTSSAFNPGEAVTFWYNRPDGTAATLYLRDSKLVTDAQHREHQNGAHVVNVDNGTSLIADASGTIAIPFVTAGLAPGSYSVVANGSMSGITVVIPFTVQ